MGIIDDYTALLSKAGALAILLKIGIALLILAVGYLLIKIIAAILKKALTKSKLEYSAHGFILKAVKIILWVIVIVMMLQALGVNTASIVAVIGASGAAIALALKDSLSNVAGGILILVNKPFKVSDEVNIAGSGNGIVDKIDIMTTHLHTWDNKSVIVPNASVVNNAVVNFTASGLRRLEHTFAVSNTSDIETVKDCIRKACAGDAVFETEPAPVVGASGNAEGAIIFDCKVWVKTKDYYAAAYRLREGVAKEFAAAGISAPSKPVVVNNA